VHVYLAARGDIHMSIHDDGNHEPRAQRGTIPLAVLFRGVNWQLDVSGIEREKNGRSVYAVPSFVATAHTTAFCVPLAETAGVAPGFSNFMREDVLIINRPFSKT